MASSARALGMLTLQFFPISTCQ